MVGEKKGNILDNYVFEKNLGAGAFGEVKKAKHKVTQCLRAVKIIKKTGMTEEEIEDLKNEIEILREMVIIILFFNIHILIIFFFSH